MESDVTNEENDVGKEENAVTNEEASAAQKENDVTEENAAAPAVVEEEIAAVPEASNAEEVNAVVEEGAGVAPLDTTKKWYVIHTYSGFENKVKMSLEERFDHAGLNDKLGDIIIPTEEVVEIRGGKKKISSRKFYPGYVLISVDMDQDIWYLIKNTSKVTGFPGGATPAPLSAAEVKDVMDQIKG